MVRIRSDPAAGSFKNEPFLQLAGYTAALCKEAILNNSAKAIKDMQAGIVSEEFVHLSEIVFAVAGLVGGLEINMQGTRSPMRCMMA